MVTLWEVIAVISTILVFLYSYYGNLKKSGLTAYFVGIILGLIWEMSTEPLFNYSSQNFGIFIWKDIPLAIIMGWGVTIAGFQIISDKIHKNYKIKANSWKSLFSDMAVAGALGFMLEYLGSHNFALWTYPPTDLPLIAGIPIVWLIGWFYLGTLYLTFIRRLENLRK